MYVYVYAGSHETCCHRKNLRIYFSRNLDCDRKSTQIGLIFKKILVSYWKLQQYQLLSWLDLRVSSIIMRVNFSSHVSPVFLLVGLIFMLLWCLMESQTYFNLSASSLGGKKKTKFFKNLFFLVSPEKFLGLLWLEQRVINQSPQYWLSRS